MPTRAVPDCARKKPLRTINSDRRGAVLVEFAFIVVPFFALLFAILQTSLTYFANEALETGVEAAARSVVTGKNQLADSNGKSKGMTDAQLAERFRQQSCTRLLAFMTCDRLMVEVRSSTDWTTIDTSLPTLTYDSDGNVTNTFDYDPGAQGAIVMVRFMYLWPIEADPLIALANIEGSRRLLVTTSVAKTEAYQ
jgi:Flp pilus assembly protein TadG